VGQPQPAQQPAQQPPAAAAAGAGAQLLGSIRGLHKYIEEEVAGAADLEELKEVVLGMARTQRTLAVLCLLLAEKQLELPKEALITLVEAELKQDAVEKLIAQDDAEGKG
jgi:hypothetical protein